MSTLNSIWGNEKKNIRSRQLLPPELTDIIQEYARDDKIHIDQTSEIVEYIKFTYCSNCSCKIEGYFDLCSYNNHKYCYKCCGYTHSCNNCLRTICFYHLTSCKGCDRMVCKDCKYNLCRICRDFGGPPGGLPLLPGY